MELEQALGNVSLFEGLDNRHLRTIARRMKVVNYQPEHVVIEEGSGGYGGMGIVLKGSCKVVRRGETVAHIGPGQVFGEMSLIDDRPRSASVVAEEPTEAAVLSAPEFRSQMRETPEIAFNLLKTLSGKIRDAGR